jgi:hypothetical protein
MLSLAVAIEGLVAHDALDFSEPVTLSWQLAAGAARAHAPARTVLLGGDSLVKHGLIPQVITARSGQTAVNLAVARGSAPATFFLVRRALEAGARPAALVVDFKPNLLRGGPRYNNRYWQEILTPRELLELTRSSRSSALFIELAVGRLLPSFRSRLEIRSHLQAALRGETDHLRLINRMCVRNWTINDGADVASKNPAWSGVVGPETDDKYQTRVFDCHRVNAEYIRRLFALTASRGIAVYWLLPPLSPQLQVRREMAGAEAGFEQFVRSMQATAANVTVLDARHSGYGHRLFVDATHLNGEGAQSLSRDVADVLRRDLEHRGATVPGGPVSWVGLPAYRVWADALVLEDVEQSRRVVSRVR